MATINIWKCDVCKKEFKEEDECYKNRFPINIEIEECYYSTPYKIKIKDACQDCRQNLIMVIDNKLNELYGAL